MISMLPFNPVVTSTSINTLSCYDYSPSAVAGRVFWTCGLGTDAIVSYKSVPAKPWVLPGKLVADPAAVKTPSGFVVVHTIGEPDGTRNGLGLLTLDGSANVLSSTVLVKQSMNKFTYGTGQPSMCPVPGNRYVVFHREDGPNGESMVGAFEVDSRSLQYLRKLSFASPEDGASPEIFYKAGRIYMVLVAGRQAGSGYIGYRTFQYDQANGVLTRDRSAESAYPLSDGNFWAIKAERITNVLDGAGVVRNALNDPVISNGKITYWRGHALTGSPVNWKLVKGTLSVL